MKNSINTIVMTLLFSLSVYSQTWNVPPVYPSVGYDNTYIGTTAGDFNVRVGGVTIMKFNKTSATDTRIGISTTSPVEKLHVNTGSIRLTGSGAATNPVDAFTTGALRLGNNGANYSWMQSHASNSTYSSLILNPLGGNVGIGTSTPSQSLEISRQGADVFLKLARVVTGQENAFGSSGIIFHSGAMIDQSHFASYGSDRLNISNGGGALISLYGSNIFFGGLPEASQNEYAGKFGFNNLVWAKSLIVSDYGSPAPGSFNALPTGYKFAVNGKTNLLNNVLIGVDGTGVTTPYKLDVQAPTYQLARFMNTTGTAQVTLKNSTSDVWGLTNSGTGNNQSVPSGTFYLEYIGTGPMVAVTKTGSVGVGVNAPTEKLHVKGNVKVEGKIAAVEICANTTSSWCDYVFEPTYDLPKLSQVQDFIDKHKHLPDVPSEADVKANGYNLTKMDAILLKKLEEAYLYILDLEARMKLQEAEK